MSMKTIKNLNGWYVCLLMGVMAVSCTRQSNETQATGIFESTEVTVSAELPGRLVSMRAEEGSLLQAGEEFALIDTMSLHLAKEQILSSQNTLLLRQNDVSTQIAALQGQLEMQERERGRFDMLVNAGAAPRKTLEDIESQIGILKSQIAAHRQTLSRTNVGISGEVVTLSKKVEQLNYDIARSVMRAPISGEVLVRYAEQGEYAAPGKPVIKMADTRTLFLRAYITANQFAAIKTGQYVQVVVDGDGSGEKIYPGRISWIASKAEFTPKTIQTQDERQNLVYAIKIMVQNDGYLKIGMYGEVKF